ncbi:hypothetical protein M758_10G144100 [Ceratodon purpureus]|uniref:Secreted protein n=1 Tax=Ceratodon purpureus TaxID=3225 RepID=A0A8T0GM03_CERPU|nr:hypothetical protein KC19_10G149800 [Ceratodon purpureus]KAG0604090.1 hypothetical protein M758_10G144100 [Ceratodon purpureus]
MFSVRIPVMRLLCLCRAFFSLFCNLCQLRNWQCDFRDCSSFFAKLTQRAESFL